MICQKSGQPTELCKECQETKAKAQEATANKVTEYRNEVTGDHQQENANGTGNG